MSTGKYIGNHAAPPVAPAARCTSCGNITASAIIPADTSALTVIFMRMPTCLRVKIPSNIIYVTPLIFI